MTKQTINVGSGEFAGDGESIRSAFVKTNENFDEVYTTIYTSTNSLSDRFGNLVITDQTISASNTNTDITISSYNGKLLLQGNVSYITLGQNLDSVGTTFGARVSRGTKELPLKVLADDVNLRLSILPFNDSYVQGLDWQAGITSESQFTNSIEFVATEDYVSDSNLGSAINFYNSPTGYGEKTLSASMDGTGLVFVANTLTDIGITFADGSRLTSSNGIGGDRLTAGTTATLVLLDDGTLKLTHPTEWWSGAYSLEIQKAAGNYHTFKSSYGLSLQATPVPNGYGLNTNTNFVDIFHDGVSVNVNDNTWGFGTDGSLAFPTAGAEWPITEYYVPTLIGKDQISFATYNAENSTSSYAVSTQDNKSWEVFAEDDSTRFSGWAYLRVELPTIDTPQVNIETRKGIDGVDYTWTFDADGKLTTPGHIIPNADLAYDLGSTSSQWRSLYVGTSTIYLGGIPVSVADGQLTVDGSPVQTDRLSSGTQVVYLTDDGKLNLPRGSLLFNNTASVVVSLRDINLDTVLDYSTTSTDYIPIDTYGNENPYNAPYTVIRLLTTPDIPLFQGDVIAGAGFPVPSTIKYAGTGTYTNTLILDSDLTGIFVPTAPITITVARPIINDALTISSAPGVDLVLEPGGTRNIIVHNDIIPATQYGSSLGSPENRFRHLWMGAGTIYLKDEVTNADNAITAQNGLFTMIGAAGLQVGEFVFIDNELKIKNNSRDLIIGTTTATGYVTFNRPVKMNGSSGQRVFEVTRDGLVTIQPKQDISISESALSIIGNAAGLQQPRNFTGTMLQITGQNGISTRVSIDAFGTGAYPLIAGRAARGTVQAPTAVKNKDILLRFSTQGYGDNQYVQSIGRISIEASQDFTNATAGTQVVIQTTPNGSNVITTSTVFNDQGIDFDGNANGGITFYDRSRQTTAFTGTVDVSVITNLDTVAVTEVTVGVGLSGGGVANTVSIDNTGVLSIAGTANQISVNGATTSTNGAITLSLPQDIAPSSNVTFNDVNITGQLNLLSTTTILIPSTVEGTILYLGFTATNVSELDGGGIQLGNTTTGIASILWNRNSNYWDFDGSGINTQQFLATESTLTNVNVIGSGRFGIRNEDNTYAGALIQVDNDLNGYGQILNVNHNAGTQSSADIVAVNDIGNDGSYFIDMGINGSNYNTSTWKVNGANDGYLYVQDGNLAVGTTQDSIVFFTNGTLEGNIEATITDAGLTVANTVTSAGFYGPLTGDVVGNVTGTVSGNAGSVTNGVYSNQTYTNPTWIGSLAGTKITGAVALATTVTNGVYTTDNGTVSNNMLAGNIANNKLAFNQITFTAGTGIGVSVASPSLGGSTTISNTGVTRITTGSGIIISTATGEIVISAAVPQGPTGYTGSFGATGYVGSAGTNGTNGGTGYTGSFGATGFVGSYGAQGYWGSVGYVGSKGVADVYVSSISAGTGTTVTTSTGAVTVYIGQAVGTNNDVTFNSVSDVAGNLRSIPIRSTSTSYTLTSADNGRVVSITTGSVTVPANVFASPYGQTISIYNNTVTTMSVLAGANVTLRLAGTLSTGTRTLARYGIASVMAVSSNTFVISGAGLA